MKFIAKVRTTGNSQIITIPKVLGLQYQKYQFTVENIGNSCSEVSNTTTPVLASNRDSETSDQSNKEEVE